MRFTVKAKLAAAFGLVIILSMVAGGVAYMKLGDMMATADSMVLRAKRMEKAGEVERTNCGRRRTPFSAPRPTRSGSLPMPPSGARR